MALRCMQLDVHDVLYLLLHNIGAIIIGWDEVNLIYNLVVQKLGMRIVVIVFGEPSILEELHILRLTKFLW